jgi:hypothetical protein
MERVHCCCRAGFTAAAKLSVWKELLDELDLRGDEHVLDIGCGRGAVLISAAHRLPRGQATGADIWRLRDQTGNSRRTSRYTTSTGGRGPAFPAITSRWSRPESQPPGRTASRQVHGAGPVLVTRCTHTKAQARAGVLVLGLHRS